MNENVKNEPCETHKASISALIDGELEAPDQLPAVDHLLACASCRAFYRRARALGDMLVAANAQDADPAPEEVWERIAAASGMARDRSARWAEPRRFGRWAAQLAAVLLLGFALGWLWPRFQELPTAARDADPSGEVEVVLEEDRGSMTDERFVELATEILRADREYHRKMLEVMAVVTAVERPEGTPDDRSPGLGDRARRISLGENEGEDSLVWSGDRL